MIHVEGYCPACGRAELVVLEESVDGSTSRVHCNSGLCPDFLAAHKILSDPEIHHIVRFQPGCFNVQHPLRERLDGQLLDCMIHDAVEDWLSDQDLPDLDVLEGNTYRFTKSGDAWSMEKLN